MYGSFRVLGILMLVIGLQSQIIAQVPFVRSISKVVAKPQETIVIQGVNFGTNPANLQVLFGNAAATPQKVSDQYMEVKVPYGAAFSEVNVINTALGLGGYSKDPFLLSYGGKNPFSISQLSTQNDFASESDLYDMVAADFDGDGLLDIATANQKSTSVSFFLNTSTPGSVSFTKTLITPGVFTFHVAAGDLDGDGKQDIVLSELNGARLFIYRNTSTVGSPSFTQQVVNVTGAKVSQVRIIDLDLNGHPDLVLTDQSGSRIFVASNQSTLGTINFPTVTTITLPGTSVLDGITVGDLDGDNLPEIVACEFQSPTGVIFVLKNESVPGTFTFASPLQLVPFTAISNVRIGDLDGDSKPDLAASALLASSVIIYGNKSTSSGLQFANPAVIPSGAKPWGVDFGDLDGDGKMDIAVGSITQKSITILNNLSTVGTFAFQTLTIPTTYITRFVKIVDIDNDGRPDINFTSIDDGVNNIPASKVSILLNHNCVLPVIAPVGPLTICSSNPQRLVASSSPGSSYEWFNGGVSMASPGPNNYLDVSASGTYTVKLTNGSCANTSAGVQITVVAGSAAPVTPVALTPVCVGGTLSLSVNNVGASDYVWTGPAFATPAHGLTVTSNNFQSSQAGEYTVAVMVGTCVAETASVIVDVVDVPNVQVQYSGAPIICQGQTKLYSVYPTVTGYSYQWGEQTSGDIVGQTGSTFTATTTGNYYVKLQSTLNPTCPSVQSAAKNVRIAQIPVVNFTAPSVACINQVVNFTDQSTLDSDTTGLHVNYLWNFGDAATSTLQNPTHTYTTASSGYTVMLTVSYNQGCSANNSKTFAVQNAPTLAITSTSGVFSFCPSDSVQLQVASGFDTYSWSTGSATATTYVKKAGTITINVTKGSCNSSTSQAVTQYAVDVTATASPTSIKKGSSSQLTATGLNTFLWKPNGADISDSTVFNPTVTPTATTIYTVSGTDANGCKGQASVEVFLAQTSSYILSPDDNNGINDTWQIVEPGKQCKVSIYDERGLKIFEANPYGNDWKGISSNGKVLPAGPYYYVMKCEDSGSNYTAGCINIVR